MSQEMSVEKKVLEIAKEFISEDIAPEKIGLETGFAELGINSANFTRLLIKVESVFGFETEEEKLHISNYTSLKDLVTYIKIATNGD